MLIFYPNKHTASTFTLTRHLFLLLFLNMYTYKFKVFANIVNPAQIITSEVTSRWLLTKNKKKIKEHAKKNSFTVHLLSFSLIILITFHTIFVCFYLALFQYFHDIWLKYTPNLEMAVWSGDLPSLLMAIVIVGVKYKVKILCPLNNLWMNALISFEVCRMVYHYSIEVKFDFGNHPKNFGRLIALYLLD